MKGEGYSLVEVLVSILIMAFVAMGISALLPSGYSQVTASGRLSIMSHYGQQKMDQLRALGTDSNQLLDGLHPATSLGETFPEFVGNTDNRYTLEWLVASGPVSDTKEVKVTVRYNYYNPDGTVNTGGINIESYRFLTYITAD